MGYDMMSKLGAIIRRRKRTAVRRRRRNLKEARFHKHEDDLSVVSVTDPPWENMVAASECLLGMEWAIHKSMKEVYERVCETGGFDVDHIEGWQGVRGTHAIGSFKGKDCPLVVNLYAKFGLHLYNLSHETNWQLREIVKYTKMGLPRPASYYITLTAEDPNIGSPVTFQTSVEEESMSVMYITSYVARRKDQAIKGKPSEDEDLRFFDVDVPQWPIKETDPNANRFFYEVPETLWKKCDWIRLYTELAFVTRNRQIHNPKLSDLKIVSVLFETEYNVRPLQKSLQCFQNANVYIRYDQDLGEDHGLCKHRAVIRRAVDLETNSICLIGVNLPVLDSE